MKHIQTEIEYWPKSAKKNLEATQVLFDNKHYDSALFFGHLVLEKMLKGLVVKKTRESAPRIHDLERLALIAGIELTEEQARYLRIITDFNIAGRYTEAKFAFYKKCTKDYTNKYLKVINDLFIWLKKEYQKKQ